MIFFIIYNTFGVIYKIFMILLYYYLFIHNTHVYILQYFNQNVNTICLLLLYFLVFYYYYLLKRKEWKNNSYNQYIFYFYVILSWIKIIKYFYLYSPRIKQKVSMFSKKYHKKALNLLSISLAPPFWFRLYYSSRQAIILVKRKD